MIDPQGQANKWVKNMEKSNNLHVIKPTSADFVRVLENCIQFGTPVLLDSQDFKFYVTSKLRNPHYFSEVSVKVRHFLWRFILRLYFFVNSVDKEKRLFARVLDTVL
jgi:hypothetical protein